MQKVYIELVFLDNFMINLLVILLASRLTRSRIRWGRFTLAAAAGGVYACVALTGGVAEALPVKAAVSMAMCFIGFWVPGEKRFWLSACAFWATSFVLAGAVYACMIGFGEPAMIGSAIVVRPPVRIIIIGLFTGTVFTMLLGQIRQRVQQREQACIDMRLVMGERQTQVKAFVDTGNLAKDPISGCGVVFLSKAAAFELLGIELFELAMGKTGETTNRLRLVPCATAVGQGILYGIEIDKAALCAGGGGVHAVVCMSKRALPGYDAIVGSGMAEELKRGAENEDTLVTETGGMDAAAARTRSGRRLHKRERSTSAATDASGGGHAVAPTGRGRQVSETDAD